jgi:glucose/arabinose dehydrogenase
VHLAGRPLRVVGIFSLLVTLLPFGAAAPVLADSGATVPPGFQDEVLLTGLDHPMAVVFAPNGNVFVAEKRGVIKFYSSITDPTPTVFADLNTNVHNYWDRGLMGLAVDPGFTTGRPFVYVLYAYNHILGDPAGPPRWPSGANQYDDRCPSPPQGTADGCVISGRLSRLTANAGVMSGGEQVLVEDWCQQFPSHSLGSLMFGSDGALYASGGEGASFGEVADYGQLGGTLPGTPTPINPCGDPGGSNPSPPSAEGGALRSQDMRTGGDPQGLGGTIIRIDPDTGAGSTDNATHSQTDPNARRIIAYGLRNPYRFTINPSTGAVWVGDVGFNTWEELNRLADPDAAPSNFGWPCYEGGAVLPAYAGLGLGICSNLAPSDVTLPYYAYNHHDSIITGDGCGVGSSSISGLAFLPDTSPYPAADHGALFMTDYTRRCIWELPAGSGGNPDISQRRLFANLKRPSGELSGGSVFLTVGPTGALVYADYDRGEIRTIRYYGSNVPPVPDFTATPSFGSVPLPVTFDASGSTDADADPLTYAWDLDGDGQYDDATGVTTSRTYTIGGDVTVGLQVSDGHYARSTVQTVSVANSPPTVTIDSPMADDQPWSIGDTISFSASATDPEDGALPPSAYNWTLIMRHCPSDCHSHIIQTFSGVKSGSFVAGDLENPSHLLLQVDVTDSGGLTAHAEVELFPATGTVAATTSPAGIPITVGPATGAPPPAVTGIVNSTVSVSAPATAQLGETIWSFHDWDDLGARTHAVPIALTPTTVTATYTATGTTDRADSCASSPGPVTPPGTWLSGKFGKTNDVDWYRFKLTATTRVWLVLGDLTAGGRMSLYSGCSKVLTVSDNGGNAPELIIQSLPAGSYAVRLSGNGTSASPSYAFMMKKMPNTVHVLTAHAKTDGTVFRLVGEVYNNTSRSVGPVTVTARLYDSHGKLLATRSAKTLLTAVPSHGRVPFSIDGSRVPGFARASYSVSAPATSRLGAPTITVKSNALNSAGKRVVSGTVRNPYSTTITSFGVAVTLYDARAGVLDVKRAVLGASRLGPGASTTFSAVFLAPGLMPMRTYVRGLVHR